MKAVVVMTYDPHKDRYDVGVSLLYSIDQWFYRGKGMEIKRITRELPLYFAFFIKERIEQRIIQDPKRKWFDNDIYTLFEQWISEDIEQLAPKYKGIIMQLWNRAQRETCQLIFERNPLQDIEGDAVKLLSYIEGRRWLFEHLEKRLKMIGLTLQGTWNSEQNPRHYLYALLQYLFLQGEIEFTSGIVIRKQKDRVEISCERCGSIDYGIHAHYCSLCGQDDFVCDTCYVMGISKGCSLVISRPKKDRTHHEVSTIHDEATVYKYFDTDWIGKL